MSADALLLTCEGNPYVPRSIAAMECYVRIIGKHSLEKQYEIPDFRKEIGQAENNFSGVYTTIWMEGPVLRCSHEILACQYWRSIKCLACKQPFPRYVNK